jgi:uncharacterized protein
MAHTDPPNVEVDLEALDDFLMSDHMPESCMGLSDLDGFLTGIVVGPELIQPAEWMPVIWGDDEPNFGSTNEATLVAGMIMARHTKIIAHLDAGLDAFDPLFLNGPKDEVIVTDWAGGFLDAVRLRTTAWDPLIRHRRAQVLITPLILLGMEDNENQSLDEHAIPPDAMKALLLKGPEIIPQCVVGIRAFWREHASKPTPKSRRRPR